MSDISGQDIVTKDHSLNLSSYFNSEEYSDLTVVCKGVPWYIHRLCVCPQSDFFKAVCKEGFKEAKEAVVTLDEEDMDTVHVMLSFFYNSKIQCELCPPTVTCVAFFARLHTAADKFLAPGLKAAALSGFTRQCLRAWDTKEFAEGIAEVFAKSTYDRILRDMVVAIIRAHSRLLLYKSSGTYPHLVESLENIPELCRDICSQEARGVAVFKPYKCIYCTAEVTLRMCIVNRNTMMACSGCNKKMSLEEWKDSFLVNEIRMQAYCESLRDARKETAGGVENTVLFKELKW